MSKKHQSPRLNDPNPGPSEVAAAERACEAIAVECEKMEQRPTPSIVVVPGDASAFTFTPEQVKALEEAPLPNPLPADFGAVRIPREILEGGGDGCNYAAAYTALYPNGDGPLGPVPPPKQPAPTLIDKIEEDIGLNGTDGAYERAKEIVRDDIAKAMGMPPKVVQPRSSPRWGDVTVIQRGQ